MEHSQRRNRNNVKQSKIMSKLEALFDAVIVKPIETEETMYGSIVIPDAGKDRNEHGTVIAVGPGTYTVQNFSTDTIKIFVTDNTMLVQ